MAVTLTLIGKTPGQTQFGLDTFTEHYKCDATADVVLTDAGVPQMASAHPDYDFMFVTSRYVSETSESASALDLVYTGCLASLDDAPVLPPQQNQSDTQVQSASSSVSRGGVQLTSPATIQFYALTNTLSYISFEAPGTDAPPDPTGTIVVITYTVGDTAFTVTGAIDALVANFFSQLLTSNQSSKEIVAGKFWMNEARKTLAYVPFLFTIPTNGVLELFTPGDGYTVGDVLTVSAGGETATATVLSVGSIFGTGTGIISYEQTSSTFTMGHTDVAATGGTGTGAAFNVLIF